MNSVSVEIGSLRKDFKEAVQKGCAQDSVNIHDFIRLFYLGQMVRKHCSISFDLNPVHSKMKCYNSSVIHYEYIFEDLWTIPFTLSNQALLNSIIIDYVLFMSNSYQQYCGYILEELERQELAQKNNIKYKRALIGCAAAASIIGGALLIKHSDSLCAMLQKWQENSYSFVSVQSWLKESKIGKFFGQDSVSQATKKEQAAAKQVAQEEQIKAQNLLEQAKACHVKARGTLFQKRDTVISLKEKIAAQELYLNNLRKDSLIAEKNKKVMEAKKELQKLNAQWNASKTDFTKFCIDFVAMYPECLINHNVFIEETCNSELPKDSWSYINIYKI